MKVSDLQIEDEYITVLGTDSILEVTKKLAKEGIPDAIVIDEEGKTLGALDDYDIISKVIAEEKDVKSVTAADIMFSPPPVRLTTELADVKKILDELEITVVPVVDDENKLIGVATVMDILEGLAYEESQNSWWKKLLFVKRGEQK